MIEQTVARVVYQGDGRTKEFPFAFPVLDRKFIYVVISDRNGREKTLKSDYYVDMDKHVVLYPGYPKGEEPAEAERPAVLAPGEKIVIYRNTPVSQLTSLGDKWPFDVCEKALDKLTMIDQENKESISRTVRLAGATEEVEVVLPPPEKDTAIGWSEDGKSVVNVPVKRWQEEARAAAAEAQTQASMAMTYKEESKESRRKAERSEEKAKEYADRAVMAENKAYEYAIDAEEKHDAFRKSAETAMNEINALNEEVKEGVILTGEAQQRLIKEKAYEAVETVKKQGENEAERVKEQGKTSVQDVQTEGETQKQKIQTSVASIADAAQKAQGGAETAAREAEDAKNIALSHATESETYSQAALAAKEATTGAKEEAVQAKNDAVAAATKAGQSETAATSAQTAAETANTNAQAANTAAQEARKNAETAAQAANGAASSAGQSAGVAKNAQTVAGLARTAAQAAQTAAQAANTDAQKAKDAAEKASMSAEAANRETQTASAAAQGAATQAQAASREAQSASASTVTELNALAEQARSAESAAATSATQAKQSENAAATSATEAKNAAKQAEQIAGGDFLTTAKATTMFADKDGTATALESKANATDVYTKIEADGKYLQKTDKIDAYTKAESDAKYQLKGTYASVEYVDGRVANIVNSAPETLDTLQELAQALGNNPNFATTVANEIGTKADKATTENALKGKANAADVYPKTESDGKYQAKGNYVEKSTWDDTFVRFIYPGNHQPYININFKDVSFIKFNRPLLDYYDKQETDTRYQKKGDSYTKVESDSKYQAKGDYVTTGVANETYLGKNALEEIKNRLDTIENIARTPTGSLVTYDLQEGLLGTIPEGTNVIKVSCIESPKDFVFCGMRTGDRELSFRLDQTESGLCLKLSNKNTQIETVTAEINIPPHFKIEWSYEINKQTPDKFFN